jgi:hypothetical protein
MPLAVSRLGDAENVPLICPTCQNVFCGQASMPATPLFARGSLLCMGLFSIFLFGGQIGALRPSFPQTSFLGGSPLNQASMPSTIWR